MRFSQTCCYTYSEREPRGSTSSVLGKRKKNVETERHHNKRKQACLKTAWWRSNGCFAPQATTAAIKKSAKPSTAICCVVCERRNECYAAAAANRPSPARRSYRIACFGVWWLGYYLVRHRSIVPKLVINSDVQERQGPLLGDLQLLPRENRHHIGGTEELPKIWNTPKFYNTYIPGIYVCSYILVVCSAMRKTPFSRRYQLSNLVDFLACTAVQQQQ